MILLGYFVKAAWSTLLAGCIYSGWRRYFRSRPDATDYPDSFHILLAATFAWGQVFVVVLALGLAKVLYGSYAVGANAAITGYLLGVSRGSGTGADWARRWMAGAVEGMRDLRLPGVLVLLLGLVASVWFGVFNIAFPPGGYDDFVFHLPSAALFVQHHAIEIFHVAPVQQAINNAPKFGELFSVWQFFIVGNDRLINFWTIGFFLQYLLAVYGLCRELGASRSSAASGSILSALAPVFLCQMLTANNDLPMCAMFATALRFAVARQRGFVQRVATAVSCGLLLSSKTSALLLFVVTMALFSIAELVSSSRPGWLTLIRRAIAITAIGVALGGTWQVRNLIEYKNPFFPFAARIAGVELPGPITHEQELRLLNRELAAKPLPERLWRLWREEKSHFGLWLYNYDSAYAGLGPIFFILGIPSIVAASLLASLARRWLNTAVLLLLSAAYLAFGGNISPRLSLFILPAVAVGLSEMLQVAGGKGWRADPLGRAVTVGICALGLGLGVYTIAVTAMSPVDPVSLKAQLFGVARDKDSIGGTFLNGFVNVRRAIPQRAVIAYDESVSFLWPYWRPDWTNEVHFVPSGSLPWEEWTARAAAVGATHVIVGRPARSRLHNWLTEHSQHFRPMGESGFGALYAFTR